MNIAIDGYEANQLHRVGIGEYAYQIVRHLHLLLLKSKNLSATLYLPENPLVDMPPQSPHWRYALRKPKKLWTFGALPFGIMTQIPRPDVIFSPTHYIPRFVPIPRVMSIMDLSFLTYPDLFRKKDLYQLVQWTEYSVRHSRAIFTISEFSRNAIIKQYQIDPKRVIVTYPGLIMKKQDQTTKTSLNLPNPYILSVGTIQPRKNYEKLIQAFSELKKTNQYKDLELVIVGKKGWLYESIIEAPQKYGVNDYVKFLDFVPDEDLPGLYSNAECFALVSLYEGFGLPVLEAMANQCLVVTSNVSSLPEIAGDAGIYVDPEKLDSIVKGLTQALQEKKDTSANKRIAIGKDRIKLFSWEKAAEQTLDILEKVGSGEL